MKILQIAGAVVAVHVLAFLFIFASPGCSSAPRNVPTPDATVPTAGPALPPVASASIAYTPAPVDLGAPPAPGASGRAEPTRPGSPNAAAIAPARPAVEDVTPAATYTVARGDSLWSIAKRNNLSVAELARANSLSTGATLRPGQKLIVPGRPAAPQDLAAPASAPKAAEARPARSAEAVTHTVLAGESLGTIARKYQVTVAELAAANTITDPAKIRAGQQLVIPGFKGVGASGRPASAPAKAGSPPAATTPAEPAVAAPKFDLSPPPADQDLDAGLKGATDVPTIKVEGPPAAPPKG